VRGRIVVAEVSWLSEYKSAAAGAAPAAYAADVLGLGSGGGIAFDAGLTGGLLGGLVGGPDEAQGWQERALCAETDPEAFFPEKGGSTREAKKICTGCEVRAECLEYALANDERFGIWGGLSERERRRLRRRAG
jgi:WhiB family transcriptional regulator, redox-sensing transcriptional regulator